jgi:hypothetical protein
MIISYNLLYRRLALHEPLPLEDHTTTSHPTPLEIVPPVPAKKMTPKKPLATKGETFYGKKVESKEERGIKEVMVVSQFEHFVSLNYAFVCDGCVSI